MLQIVNMIPKSLFPNGVTYQRNADFATQTLLGTDNTSPVDISIDPFFVRYTPPRVVSTELS